MKKGITLILTIIVVTLALAIVFSASGIFIAELVASQNIDLSTVAFYIADAGIEGELYRDRIVTGGITAPFSCNTPPGTNVDNDTCLANLVNQGSYSYTVQNNVGAPRIVVSIGNYRGVKRSIELRY